VALVIAALLLDGSQRGRRDSGGQLWFDNAVCASASPVQGALVFTLRFLDHQWQALTRGQQLLRENTRLAAKVGELQSKLTYLEETVAAADRSQTLRDAYPGVDRNARVAQVIAQGSGGWLSYLVVDAGSESGVRVRDVAVTREGLVGQVYAVTRRSARIVPITDPTSGVATLTKLSRERGIVKGAGTSMCSLKYLRPAASIKPGDEVLTTGDGGVFPKGLRVGTVVSVQRDAYTEGKTAAVRPAVAFRGIEEVLLIPSPSALQ
jgi:rod shape-determining protein MreC